MQALINKSNHFPLDEMRNNLQIGSDLFSLQKVVGYNIQFNIPIYQRLYVWKFDQIRTLLEDVRNSFLKDNSDFYFLGAVMLSSTIQGKIDLVDGQQRFTTLWLICDALSQEITTLKQFTYFNSEPRIHFSIRDKAQEYLKNKDSFKDYLNDKGELIEGIETEVSEIIPLAEGRNIIRNIIDDFKKESSFDVLKFGEYIYKNVYLTYTILPGVSDLNRVFEAMNNRGKQLEHHEILKSRLLEKIEKEERNSYSLIWDACSQMNSYIEKNIKDVADLTWKEILRDESVLNNDVDEKQIDLSNVEIISLLAKKNISIDNTDKKLLDILSDEIPQIFDSENDAILESEYVSKSVRSIISFPVFLLHAFRVYQIKLERTKKELLGVTYNSNLESAEVNDKKLLDIFDVKTNFSETKKVKEFILLLWELRVQFDKYVIKWIYDEGQKDEFHSLENIQISITIIKNKDGSENENLSVQRIETSDDVMLTLVKLQGMLYHSQEMTTQYWLTPFLLYLLENRSLKNIDIIKRLEKLENELFFSEETKSKLKDRTCEINFRDESQWLNNLMDSKSYLAECKGTDYPNYIFYKLEYVLWKFRFEICDKYKLDIEKWKNYRLTAKNSVEHIFPQTIKEENKHINFINEKILAEFNQNGKMPLDDFGNLVLLSPGMNSEYSNKPYKEKRGQFISKLEVDSLKSDIIFKNEYWDWELVENHRNEMIIYLVKYINDLKNNK